MEEDETMAKDAEWTVATLASAYMRATGVDEEEAADALARIIAGWARLGMTPDNLPPIVATMVNAKLGMDVPQVLSTLYGMPRLAGTQNGCELIFALAVDVARRCGVGEQLMQKLREVTAPASRERGH